MGRFGWPGRTGRCHSAWSCEAVNCGDDGLDAAHGARDVGAPAYIADDDLGGCGTEGGGASRITREHPDRQALVGESVDDERAESSAPARDEDHLGTTWARTASSTVAAVASTGSR